jgi:DNA-binding Xre family transcriptional regulator
MIIYNFKRILKARGIERPFSYLVKAGFSSSFATKVNNNRVKRLNLPEIERLCILLKCTPNDFYEWHPTKKQELEPNHPLNKIKKSDKGVNISKMVGTIPLDQLDAIEKLIANHIKE